ncbi:hypothetical protein GJA_5564 [Janthinobacterium agaricidamnosum NBRC 102515 = DSM 9628]|uniref:Uncharacterized protein n=1 Tax=Janthinobacterium agaricidamnosum NBRC 102515 = DSM 9628 TaxID=1349767 RepID=W0VDY8_9BURK|nr:hypothetical protein GJA_5564 [Janthinobacterium agaricidamnosum NBRC 102515 = DSM 9628]
MLVAVGLVGWLTVAQVAAWVWPDSGKHSATNRAAEVMARLLSGRLLMRRKSGTGVWGYLLTNTGAARANAAYEEDAFRAGYDLSMLDTYRQAAIVGYLLTQAADVKLGPAGVRGGVRCGLVESALAEADALTWSPELCAWRAALLVRNLHPEVLAKARRVRAAAGHFQLLGPPHLVQQFGRAMH